MKNATEASDRTVLLVAGLTAAALGLGFFELGKASIWLDEAVSATLAQVPFGEFAREAAAKEANMSLYYVLLRPFLWLGNSEIAVRLPSVLAFAATIPLLHRIGTRIAGPRVGGRGHSLHRQRLRDPLHPPGTRIHTCRVHGVARRTASSARH